MPISENDFNGYRNEATKGSKSFKAVSELITQKHSEYFKEVNKYYQEKTVDKATSIKSDILSRYKGAKKDALNCIVKLAETSKDYHNVLDLVCEYDDLGLAEIYYALTGCGSIKVKNIRDGQLKCPDEQKIRVSKILDFERRFSDLQIKGRRDYFNAALAFCFKCNKIDKELLFEKIKKRYRHMKPMQSIEQSLWEIEKVYNYRNSSKVSITSMYLDSKH